jgi:hypothetical protein
MLDVLHSEGADFDTFSQLSRPGAVEALDRHGPALTLGMMSAEAHATISPEEMHAVMNMDRPKRQELMERILAVRGAAL